MRKLPGYFKNIAGPAAVMAAASMGAGSASSLILTGAWFRYELLWVVLLILPLLVITVDTASRIGLLNKNKGMFSLICEHIHPGVGWRRSYCRLPYRSSNCLSLCIHCLGGTSITPDEVSLQNTAISFTCVEVLLAESESAGNIRQIDNNWLCNSK